MITDIKTLNSVINDAIDYKNQPLALEALTYIKKNNVEGIQADGLHKLGYVRFPSLSTLGASVLLTESILAGYSLPDNLVSDQVIKYFSELELVPQIVELAGRIETILLQHKEILGSDAIGKWIARYVELYKERDAYTQVKFVGSAAAKSLNKEQQAILTDILRIYDYCDRIIEFWHLLQEMPEQEINKSIDPEKAWIDLFPGLSEGSASDLIETNIANSSKPVITSTPRQVFSDITPTPRNQSSAPRAVPDSIISEANKAPAVSYNSPQHRGGEGLTSSDSAKIRDLINHAEPKPNDKRGVTMDPTNIKINEEEQRLNQARAQQAANIQNKLAELRKRNSKQ